MKARADTIKSLSLEGLEPGPPQQLGSVRLVPLLRSRPGSDLRLALRRYKAPLGVVALDGEPDGRVFHDGLKYMGYVPHGLVMSWSDDGSPVTAFGTQLTDESDGKSSGRSGVHKPQTVQLLHRMVKRESERRLRFLPLHLAMEGFLSLHFGGPDIAWSEYSRQAIRDGLDPRSEYAFLGRDISRLDAALRTFEIHDGQCGIIVCVADALASVFAVSHPDDYRLLHHSLIEDFYGELIYGYSHMYRDLPRLAPVEGPLAKPPQSVADLRRLFENARREWTQIGHVLAQGIIGRGVRSERVYRAGPFSLQRFVTSLSLHDENHIGEAIVREDGNIEYLKTFRLSSSQSKRAYLLQILAEHHWNLAAAAQSQNQSQPDFIKRMARAGFGYLIAEHVLRAARKGK
jgi:hypothetical protein